MTERRGPGRPAGDAHVRPAGRRAKTWLLLSADRRRLAVWMVAAVLLTVLLVDASGLSSLPDAVSAGDPIETLFQALVAAIITGVTLVVTLSQLVLSQELGAVGDQWERMQAAMDFRARAERQMAAPAAPPGPADFLRRLVEVAARRARDVAAALDADPPTDAGLRVRDFAQTVIREAEDVIGRLDGARFGSFAVVSAALEFDYSSKIHGARRLLGDDEVDLPADARTALERLRDVLTLFGPAREHFKTLYFEWELINLSRGMVYLAVPALAVSVASLLFLEVASIPTGTLLGASNTAWIVGATVSISVAPFVLLLSYILRIVTVAKLTLAMGPFILRDDGGSRGA